MGIYIPKSIKLTFFVGRRSIYSYF